jgi:formate dehydrogenase iron-sulfur subunit
MLTEARERIATHPDQYVDHIYGEHEGGGTSVLYLASVPFEGLGFPTLEREPFPELSERMGSFVIPGILLGGPFILAGIRYMSRALGWEEINGDTH